MFSRAFTRPRYVSAGSRPRHVSAGSRPRYESAGSRPRYESAGSIELERTVSKAFLQYLEDGDRKVIMTERQLKKIYEEEFRTENEVHGVPFHRVLNTLSYHLNECQNVQGKVVFGSGEEAVLQMLECDFESDHDESWRYAHYCTDCKRNFPSFAKHKKHLTTVQHRQQQILLIIRKTLESHRPELLQDKNGVVINSIPMSDENGVIELRLESGKSGDVTLIIRNNGEESVQLNHITLLWSVQFFDYNDIATIDLDRGIILPGSIRQFKVGCKRRKEFGYSYVPAVFSFEKDGEEFYIMRFLSVRTVSEIFDALKERGPYQGIRRPDRIPYDVVTVSGEPLPNLTDEQPRTYGAKVEKLLQEYEIPFTLKGLVGDGSSSVTRLSVRTRLEAELSFSNYKDKCSTLLHIEEIQMQKDIRSYDMKGVTFERDKKKRKLLILKVPGLAENRPSVLRGDVIFAYEQGHREKRYEGIVHEVDNLDVKLAFNSSMTFISGMKFDVQFTLNRWPVQLEHRACESVSSSSDLKSVLFPEPSSMCKRGRLAVSPRRFYDDKLNEEQKEAVRRIVSGRSRPAPYLIFGPPGTGKTVTMVEAIKQVFDVLEDSVILACAPENTAADQLAERLLPHIDKGRLFRMYASSRAWDFIPEKLKDGKVVNFNSKEPYYPSMTELQQKYRIVVTTLVTAGRLVSANCPRDHFTHIFIDEAGHAVEPEVIIPVADLLDPNNPKGGQLVLAGDPKQLGPILRSPIAKKYGLETSFLERLMNVEGVYTPGELGYNDKVMTKLVNNYRSHRDILEIPKQLFYNDELNECAGDFRNVMLGWEELPNRHFPIIFHPVYGEDKQEEGSPSFFNVDEVQTIKMYLEKLLDENVRSKGLKHLKPEMIGIISPFKRQVQKIQTMIQKKDFSVNIKVGSVEEFQGQERRIIIVSTVRSTNKKLVDKDRKCRLGFLNNPKRFNVAITRAQALLIVVGNPDMLSLDKYWRKFLNHVKTNNGWVDVQDKGSAGGIMETLKRMGMPVRGEAVDDQSDDLDISQCQLQEHPEWTRHE